jgi:hypothetical protein
MVTGAPLAASHVRILSMNQYAWCMIMFWNEVDHLMKLCFMVSSVIHVFEFVYDLSAVASSY